jgi:hypothetical protein
MCGVVQILQKAETPLLQGGQLPRIRAIAIYGLQFGLNGLGFEASEREKSSDYPLFPQ